METTSTKDALLTSLEEILKAEDSELLAQKEEVERLVKEFNQLKEEQTEAAEIDDRFAELLGNYAERIEKPAVEEQEQTEEAPAQEDQEVEAEPISAEAPGAKEEAPVEQESEEKAEEEKAPEPQAEPEEKAEPEVKEEPKKELKTKAELLAALEEISKAEDADLAGKKDELAQIKNKFNQLTQIQMNAEKAEFLKKLEEGEIENPTEVYEYQKTDEDHRFAERLNIFTDRVQKIQEEEKEKREAVKKEKQNLLEELQKLIEEEDRIGQAFKRFEEIRTRWKELNEQSTEHDRDMQRSYGQLLDQFFYNIKIYKDLRDLDLQKNQEAKEEVIARIEKLGEEQSIHKVENTLRMLQDDWNETGPTYDHAWEEIKNKYWSLVRAVYDRIKKHYDDVRAQHEENRLAKEELINKVKEVNSREKNSVKSWSKTTDKVKETQAAWKKIGYIGKEQNEKLWEEFRAQCDEFFGQKSKYFESLKEGQDKNRVKKQELVDKAVLLQDSKDWKQTAEQLKKLQNRWKQIPPARQKDERQLWSDFRAACDHFFNSRKQYFSSLDDRKAGGKKACEDLIKKANDWKASGDVNADLDQISQLIVDWYAIEFKPKDKAKDLNKEFQTVMDKHLNAIDADESQKGILRYKAKIQGLSASDRAEMLLKRELDRLNDDIRTKDDEVVQYQNNLEFFGNSKGVESLRAEVEQKIERIKNQSAKQKEYKKVVREQLQALRDS